jgi:hypothetical protein
VFVGDYTNPILKPKAAEVVKRHGDISLAGGAYPAPSSQCWPSDLPVLQQQLSFDIGGLDWPRIPATSDLTATPLPGPRLTKSIADRASSRPDDDRPVAIRERGHREAERPTRSIPITIETRNPLFLNCRCQLRSIGPRRARMM